MEGDEVVTQDAQPESSPGVEGQPTPPAAPQPGTPGQPQSPAAQQTVPYERFNQVIRQNQQFRDTVSQLQGRIQQMESLSQKAQQQGGLNPTDQNQYRDAAQAIKEIFKADPELKGLLDSGQTQQTVKSLQEAQMRSLEQQGIQRILKSADEAGLPQTENVRHVFIKAVEGMATTIPNYRQRFAQGDLTLLDEAIELAKPLLDQLKREGQTQLLDTKNRTRQLPPAPRGGAAGPPGLPKLDPNNPRAYESALHAAAAQHLGQS